RSRGYRFDSCRDHQIPPLAAHLPARALNSILSPPEEGRSYKCWMSLAAFHHRNHRTVDAWGPRKLRLRHASFLYEALTASGENTRKETRAIQPSRGKWEREGALSKNSQSS